MGNDVKTKYVNVKALYLFEKAQFVKQILYQTLLIQN